MNSGKLIIFSAPSGSGKTTLVKHLLQKADLPLAFSVSCTTRNPRPNEENGSDYYFISAQDFKNKIDENAFVEWEEVYKDHFYGTLYQELERIWAQGKHVLFDIDVQGGLNLKKKFADQALAIFVQPPNIEALEARLKARQTESDEKLKLRVAKAEHELSFASQFDYILVNDDLASAQSEAENVVSNFINS